MLAEKLKTRFEGNDPIFIHEILEEMEGYSRQRVYQMIEDALRQGELSRFDRGIYYLPVKTAFGTSIPSVNDVISKKYIQDGENVFGIYGKTVLDLNFMLSTQVPNTIEVITNNESRKVREITIRGRRVVLRKARLPINKENVAAYTLMELFTDIDMRRYEEDALLRKPIKDYIREKRISREDILRLADAFPLRTMKNIAVAGALYEIARQ